MAYITPIHPPSSVRHALNLNLLGPHQPSLVVAKGNRLEIYNLTQDGLDLHTTTTLYGTITLLHKFTSSNHNTDLLLVGVDSTKYILLRWDAHEECLAAENESLDVADKTARRSQTGDRCWVDPDGKYMTLEVYEGIIQTIPLSHKSTGKAASKSQSKLFGEPTMCRIPEFFVRSSCFLYGPSKLDGPRVALLCEDFNKDVRIRVRELKYENLSSEEYSDFVDVPNGLTDPLDLGANILIPLTSHPYGVIVLGETSIAYHHDDLRKAFSRSLEEATIFATWEQIDDERFILADDYGRLYLLFLIIGDDGLRDWRLDTLGETSRANTLVYLGDGLVFVGSHQGDSQLIRITEGAFEVEQTFSNIAPILDFTIMDMGNQETGSSNEFSSGQARVVTGSGAWNDGSLRSVRSGVGLQEVGFLGEMDHIVDMFSLRSQPQSRYHDALLVSFVNDTRLFRFSPEGDAEEVVEPGGLAVPQPTLLATNVLDQYVLQITDSSARVMDVANGAVLSEWSADTNSITAVAATESQAALVLDGSRLILFNLPDLSIAVEKTFTWEQQLSCISLSSFTTGVIAVGLAQEASLKLLNLQSLEEIHSTTIHSGDVTTDIPRSMIITRLFDKGPPTLLVGTAGGRVATFSMDLEGRTLRQEGNTILGTQEAKFSTLPRGDGTFTVFALCEHPSVIYVTENRVAYSAVTAEGATCVCTFDSEAFPGAAAIASDEGLKLALVDTERRAHVQNLRVGETVRRIAYSPRLKLFGLGTIKRTLSDGVESVESFFKLADEVVFQQADNFDLRQDELVETVIAATLPNGYAEMADYFMVGTSYLDESQTDVRGRILILEVTADRKIKLVAQHALKGACRCLALMGDKIVAALIKTVVVFELQYASAATVNFVKLASYRTATAPIDIHVQGNLIAVADLTKSVTVVEYKATERDSTKYELEEIARHNQTTWGTAVSCIDENVWLESDAEGNLLVLARDEKGVTADDRRRLRVESELCLGEMVNRIRKIDVSTKPDAVVVPKAFLATVEGSLYLFSLIAPSWLDALINLQLSLSEQLQLSLGGLSHRDYRAYKSQVRQELEPVRFVDGELVERFLGLDRKVQEICCQGTNKSVEEMVAAVEALRRLK